MGNRLRDFEKGFSVLDVLVGASIFSILMAVAVPKMSAYRASFDLNRAAQDIAFEVGRTRMLAVGENTPARIKFGNSATGLFALASDFTVERSADGVTFQAVGSKVKLPKNVQVYAFPPSLRFNRQGLATSTAAFYIFNHLNSWKIVSVNSLGRVTIQ